LKTTLGSVSGNAASTGTVKSTVNSYLPIIPGTKG